jgi:hypothetical protein
MATRTVRTTEASNKGMCGLLLLVLLLLLLVLMVVVVVVRVAGVCRASVRCSRGRDGQTGAHRTRRAIGMQRATGRGQHGRGGCLQGGGQRGVHGCNSLTGAAEAWRRPGWRPRAVGWTAGERW